MPIMNKNYKYYQMGFSDAGLMTSYPTMGKLKEQLGGKTGSEYTNNIQRCKLAHSEVAILLHDLDWLII